MDKRYGLFTAICMVIGIVIGSGVFFKAQDILIYTNGNMLYGIIAWLIGGIIMIICAFNFANFATKYERVNGIIDYSEAIVSRKYAYYMGWFMATIYFPSTTAVLAWVSARYTLVLFGSSDITGGLCMALAGLYLILSYALNILSPRLAGKLQVSSTVIKIIPLIVMAIIGLIVGLINGNTINSFKMISNTSASFGSVFAAIVASAFAYDGWITATTINQELKDSKKNLPIALVFGTMFIVIIYIIYFIGLSGGATIGELMFEGSTKAFNNLFGRVGGTVLNLFVVISCLGTLNGLMIATTRSIYSLAIRNQGPRPSFFKQIDIKTNMPSNSGVVGLVICAFWFFYFYAANLTDPIFGIFSFDSSELPIISIYGMFIPMFIMFIKLEGKRNVFSNTIMPILGIISSIFMISSAVYAHGYVPYMNGLENGYFSIPILFYLIVFFIIMIIGSFYYKNKNIDIN